MEVLQGLYDEFLSCSICLETFDEPKQLPCLHNFCRKCLRNHIVRRVGDGRILSIPRSTFPCPICRKPAKPSNADPRKLADWVDSFPTNFFIVSLVHNLENQRNVQQDSDGSETGQQEYCPRHSSNRMTKFCSRRSVGVCEECESTLNHRECRDDHLAAEGARETVENRLADFKENIIKLSKKVSKTREQFSDKPNELKLKKEEVTAEVSERFAIIKSQMTKLLLDKERECLKILSDIVRSEEANAEEGADECKSLLSSLDGTQKVFDNLLNCGPIRSLSVINNVEKEITNYTQAAEQLQLKLKSIQLSFVPDCNADRLVQNITVGHIETSSGKSYLSKVNSSPTVSLEGYFQPENSSHSEYYQGGGQQAPGFLDHHGQAVSLQARPQIALPFFRPPPPPFRFPTASSGSKRSTSSGKARSSTRSNCCDWDIRLINTFNGITSEDTRAPQFVGISQVDEDRFVVVDRWNKKLKLINVNGEILFCLEFEEAMEPWDVTQVSEARLAVTCPGYSHIIIVAVKLQSLDVAEYIRTSTGYCSLVFLEDNKYAAGTCKPYSVPKVDLLDVKGNLLMTLNLQTVIYPRTLDKTSDGCLVISDWTKKEVVILNKEYEIKFTYKGSDTDKSLVEPTGLAHDESGNVFISDNKAKAVHSISGTTGQKRGVFILKMPQIPKVIAVVKASPNFSKKRQVLVGATSGGEIRIFDLL